MATHNHINSKEENKRAPCYTSVMAAKIIKYLKKFDHLQKKTAKKGQKKEKI
jgi:hypothetical protein